MYVYNCLPFKYTLSGSMVYKFFIGPRYGIRVDLIFFFKSFFIVMRWDLESEITSYWIFSMFFSFNNVFSIYFNIASNVLSTDYQLRQNFQMSQLSTEVFLFFFFFRREPLFLLSQSVLNWATPVWSKCKNRKVWNTYTIKIN